MQKVAVTSATSEMIWQTGRSSAINCVVGDAQTNGCVVQINALVHLPAHYLKLRQGCRCRRACGLRQKRRRSGRNPNGEQAWAASTRAALSPAFPADAPKNRPLIGTAPRHWTFEKLRLAVGDGTEKVVRSIAHCSLGLSHKRRRSTRKIERYLRGESVRGRPLAVQGEDKH
jgi:hypothetical protein